MTSAARYEQEPVMERQYAVDGRIYTHTVRPMDAQPVPDASPPAEVQSDYAPPVKLENGIESVYARATYDEPTTYDRYDYRPEPEYSDEDDEPLETSTEWMLRLAKRAAVSKVARVAIIVSGWTGVAVGGLSTAADALNHVPVISAAIPDDWTGAGFRVPSSGSAMVYDTVAVAKNAVLAERTLIEVVKKVG